MPVIRAPGEIILAQSAVAVPHTGDTTETTLATITVPAGALGANGRIEIKALFSGAGGSGGKTPRVKFGGNTLLGTTVMTAATFVRAEADFSNRNGASAQEFSYLGVTSTGVTFQTAGTTAVDTGVSADITITGQLATGTDTITLESYRVILYPKG